MKDWVIGLKQSRKAIRDGHAGRVVLARDADAHVLTPLEQLCREMGVQVEYAESTVELGQRHGLKVGAAVAVLIQ